MTCSFGIPPEFEALWNTGQPVRCGALLIRRNGSGIAGHLQETGTRLALDGVSRLPGSVFAPVAAATGLVGKIQNAQIKAQNRVTHGVLAVMDGTLDGLGQQLGTMDGKLDGLGDQPGAMHPPPAGSPRGRRRRWPSRWRASA